MPHDERPSGPGSQPEPAPFTDPNRQQLTFRLARGHYALELAAISGVGPTIETRSVPLAPASVVGVAETRGRAVTILDVARILDDEPGQGPPCLVFLGEPLEHIAFRVPAAIELVTPEETDAARDDAATGPRLLDPRALVTRIESDLAQRDATFGTDDASPVPVLPASRS